MKKAFNIQLTKDNKGFLMILLLLSSLVFVDCAKKGNPTGGPKDTIPPVIVRSDPENFSTNFNSDEIKIYFNEYIKLKELRTNLLISPPFEDAPTITPLSSSKILKIKFNEALKENTTYSINFGKSIEDNNEGNSFDNFKYVFSTGDFIDSLKVNGTVTDGLNPSIKEPVSILLYEVTETYNDSIIYKEKPTYITSLSDSTSSFELTNLKQGTYRLIALQEKNNNYKFEPKTDKIGFQTSLIEVPVDTTYALTLFKETPDFKFARPKQAGPGHIIFGYEGVSDSIQINMLSQTTIDFTSIQYKDRTKDSIHYWFKPILKVDSLSFEVRGNKVIDTFNVRIKELFKDSLKITPLQKGTITLNDSVLFTATTPLVSIDESLVNIVDKDTVAVPLKLLLQKENNTASIQFKKTESQKYKITALPGAFTDFYNSVNDTLAFNIATKAASDYGGIALTLKNRANQNIIVQLTNERFEVVNEMLVSSALKDKVSFDNLKPGTFYLRLVYDKNENGVWDTGSYLTGVQPEKISYYPVPLELRANRFLEETFILE